MIGKPRILCAEMHYPRIPHEYWRDRLRMARAMGLDTVSTYVFWNRHEPKRGTYDFSGDNDVARFIRTAQEEALDVILRPGPYVCAEWDFGGLPAWLLEDGAAIRTSDERYMGPVRTWLKRLGQEIAGLQRASGGPILAVQLENEYGAFGNDRAYLGALREALIEAGLGASPLYTIDQPKDLHAGSLDDLPIAATFAPGDPKREFEQLRALRPQGPLLCGEYWAGWFDHWGEPHHRLDDRQQARDLCWMLREQVSFNIYMFHGGTNFGFWNGANSSGGHPYEPTTASYDYDAALDEAGRPTAKYALFRDCIAAETGATPPDIPPAPQTRAIPEFRLTECCSLLRTDLGEGIASERVQPMERFGQSFGYILYRTEIAGPVDGELEIDAVRDYAVVAIDGSVVARLDRRLGESRAPLAFSGGRARLEILVENGGRINYGPDLPFERKGITNAVRLNGRELLGWTVYPLPLDDPRAFAFERGVAPAPALYRGTMHVETPADTFIDVSTLGKGVLWVNGRNVGRFWNIGPQTRLYVPGVWLLGGANDVAILDLFPHDVSPRLRGDA